jgi:hypothetical protein
MPKIKAKRKEVIAARQKHGGHYGKMAKELNVSKSSIARYLIRYGLIKSASIYAKEFERRRKLARETK